LNLQQARMMRLLILFLLFAFSGLLAGCERNSGVQRQGANEGKAMQSAGSGSANEGKAAGAAR